MQDAVSPPCGWNIRDNHSDIMIPWYFSVETNLKCQWHKWYPWHCNTEWSLYRLKNAEISQYQSILLSSVLLSLLMGITACRHCWQRGEGLRRRSQQLRWQGRADWLLFCMFTCSCLLNRCMIASWLFVLEYFIAHAATSVDGGAQRRQREQRCCRVVMTYTKTLKSADKRTGHVRAYQYAPK